ncbi:TPA: hypothetical protein ACIPUI_000438 [Citrobacter freundii]
MDKSADCGAWSINQELFEDKTQIAKEYRDIFEEAVEGQKGAGYAPLLYCGHQLVSGMNYMFIARQTLTTHPLQYHIVKMVINKKGEDKAAIVRDMLEVLI